RPGHQPGQRQHRRGGQVAVQECRTRDSPGVCDSHRYAPLGRSRTSGVWASAQFGGSCVDHDLSFSGGGFEVLRPVSALCVLLMLLLTGCAGSRLGPPDAGYQRLLSDTDRDLGERFASVARAADPDGLAKAVTAAADAAGAVAGRLDAAPGVPP